MPPKDQPSNITVRGGLINVPPSRISPLADRHQPNTPPTKKSTTVRPDHKPLATEPEGADPNVTTETSQSD